MKKGEVAHTPPPPPPPLPPPALSTSPRGLPRLPSTKISSVTIGQRKSSLEQSIRDPVSFAEKRGAVALRDLRNMGLARAMRALDALRKHTPTKEEIDELGASDRLDTQVSQSEILCFFVYLGGEKSKLPRMLRVLRNEESGHRFTSPWPHPGLKDVCTGVLTYPPCSTTSIF